MRGERSSHTLQPTALVNELYLELQRMKALPPGHDPESERTEFLRFAAHLMRRKLIHHARPLSKQVEKIELHDHAASSSFPDSLVDVDRLLERLEAIDPRLRQVVEMRVFEEMTREEIALRWNCTVRTVARYWSFAQEWLGKELDKRGESPR